MSAAFALAPMAVAAADPVDTVDTASSVPDAPATDVTSAAAPSSDAPSTSDAPPTDTPSTDAPSSDAPSTDAPSSDAPSSATPSVPSHPTSVAKPRAATPKVFAPELGARKLRVGVQLKSGAYVPPGTTTMGSVIQFVQKTPEGAVDGPTLSCTTDAADVVTSTTTYCNTLPALNDNDTLVVTQVSAPTGLVVDPTEMTVPPCQTIEGLPFCLPQLAIFTDGGVAPTTTDDAADVVVGDSVDVPVLANDDLAGAPITDLQITGAPAHGTATVVPPVTPPAGAARPALAGPSTPVIRYVPDARYVGPDTVAYTVTTANGSATGTLSLTVVPPPPTAANDSARTTEGDAVTVDVTANDDANGGGALRVDSVGDPTHGSVRVDGTSVVYSPTAGFTGTDRFDYAVATRYGTDTATVTVRVVASRSSTTPPPAPNGNDGGNVANTGTDSAGLLSIAGGLLLTGGAAVAVGRRRPRRAH